MRSIVLPLKLMLMATIALAPGACAPESVVPPAVRETLITQDMLDGATVSTGNAGGITGDPFGAFGGDTGMTRHRIRFVSHSASHAMPDNPGTVWVQRVYRYDDDCRGRLVSDMIMVKRETGYFPAGGDYEYFTIPYDSTENYSLHPNGSLPAPGDTAHSGAMQRCVTCHAGAGDDRLFSR